MQLPPLLHPDRVADATIRGFLTQVYYTAMRWLDLGEHDVLLCEGDEDIDRYLFEADGSLREIRQEQIKDLTSSLSARSEPVYASLLNFLVSFVEHHRHSRRCMFVFVTNAHMANQQVQKGGDTGDAAKVTLRVDVLKTWSTLSKSTEPDSHQQALADAVRALAQAHEIGPAAADGASQEKVARSARVKSALDYLDDNSAWRIFFDSVEWRLEQPTHAAVESQLYERFRTDARTNHAPELLAQRALLEVLRASSHPNAEDRILSRVRLESLARSTFVELTVWAEKHHPERLPVFARNLEQEIRDQRLILEKTQRQVQALVDEPFERLRRASERNLSRLCAFASLRTRTGTFTFARPVATAMDSMPGSFLAIGAPGAGKSGALCSLINQLRMRGEDVVVASVDTLSEPDVLLDGLRRWPNAGRKRTLVVDALDAARGEVQASRVRKLLEDLFADNADWRVVASIRTFDLRARSELAALFTGHPHETFRDPRFLNVAHVCVGPLSDDELAQLASGYAELSAVVGRAPSALKQLLRIPFHLSLISLLLLAGDDALGLENIRTQLELLDRYWERRVATPPETKLPRNAILKSACDEIVRSRDFWTGLEALPALEHLHGLLSEQVLVHPPSVIDEFDETRVGFSHHLLFDYTCARLWMPQSDSKLVDALRTNSDLMLVARPSLDMYLRRLWAAQPDHESFWTTVLAVASETTIHEVAQIVGPAIAADSATHLDELNPLLAAFGSNGRPEAARRVITHIVGSLRLAASDTSDDARLTAEPWPRLIEYMITNLNQTAWWSVLPLLRDGCKANPSGAAAIHLGAAARRVLADARTGSRDQIIALATSAVVQTFASDPIASREALTPLLELTALDAWGHETLFALGDGVLCIASADPDLAENLYLAAFRATFTSQDQEEEHTIDRGGPLFGLRFRRSDMMRGGVYKLSKAFRTLLVRDPLHSVRILQRVLEVFRPNAAGMAVPFSFGSRAAAITEDASELWDHRLRSGGEEQVDMLDFWEARLIEVCQQSVLAADRDLFFDALALHGHEAAFWRRALRAANLHPGTVGVAVASLLSVREVLILRSTTTQAGEALSAVFPLLTPAARLAIEQVILGLTSIADDPKVSEHTVARLLGCLPRTALVSKEAQVAFDAKQTGVGFPRNVPNFQIRTLPRPFDELGYLREQGANLEASEAEAVVNALKPLNTFLDASNQGQPSAAELGRVLSEVNGVTCMLSRTAPAPALPPVLIDHAWTKVALTLNRVADRAEEAGVDVNTYLAPLALTTVATAETLTRMSTSLRRLITDVLWTLVAGTKDSAHLLDILESWLRDSDPEVRFHVARKLHVLHGQDDERLERCLTECEEHEENALVWGGLASALGELLQPMMTRTRKLLIKGLHVISETRVRQLLVHHLVELAVVYDDATATTEVGIMIDRPASSDAAAVAWKLVQWVLSPSLTEADRLESERAGLLALRLAQASAAALSRFKQDLPQQRDAARAAATTLEQLVRPLALQMSEKNNSSHATLFSRVDPIFDVAAKTGEAALVHHIVETLPVRRLVDRRGAFLRAADLVRFGFPGGYQTDSLAADAIVGFLERYLADDRALLQDDKDCREALFAILDTFVRAGWENARRLTYGLDDIFR